MTPRREPPSQSPQPERTPLGSSARTVGAARRFVRRTLRDRSVPQAVVTAVELLTSELVTNALLHARRPRELSVEVDGDHVRVEVSDASPRLPAPRHGASESVSGRGLGIVDTLACAWGVDPERGGKRVWFEVEVPAGSEDRSGA